MIKSVYESWTWKRSWFNNFTNIVRTEFTYLFTSDFKANSVLIILCGKNIHRLFDYPTGNWREIYNIPFERLHATQFVGGWKGHTHAVVCSIDKINRLGYLKTGDKKRFLEQLVFEMQREHFKPEIVLSNGCWVTFAVSALPLHIPNLNKCFLLQYWA